MWSTLTRVFPRRLSSWSSWAGRPVPSGPSCLCPSLRGSFSHLGTASLGDPCVLPNRASARGMRGWIWTGPRVEKSSQAQVATRLLLPDQGPQGQDPKVQPLRQNWRSHRPPTGSQAVPSVPRPAGFRHGHLWVLTPARPRVLGSAAPQASPAVCKWHLISCRTPTLIRSCCFRFVSWRPRFQTVIKLISVAPFPRSWGPVGVPT